MRTKIGIFGGSFNPVHMGHLMIAQDALELFKLGKVLFVPCNQPPHKNARALAPAAHRVALLEKAIAGNPGFEICDLEIRRGGTNYTIDTIRHLRKTYPKHRLFFIIGSDSLMELHLWKKIDELLNLCDFITFSRPGFETTKLNKTKLRLNSAAEALFKNTIAAHQTDISSSDIRRRAAAGMSIRYLVPPAVENYIAEHNLYRA